MRCTSPGRIAHGILVRQFPGEHIADDFHIAVGVRAEPGTGRHAILVNHP